MIKNYCKIGLLFIVSLGACTSEKNNDALTQLDKEISLKKEYDEEKEAKIRQAKKVLTHSIDETLTKDLLWEIINEYRTYQADSTEVYAIKLVDFGEATGNKEAETLGLLGLMESYTSVGYFKEASDIQDMISEEYLPKEVKPYYLDLAYRLYENLESFVLSNESALKNIYHDQRVEFLYALIDATENNTYEHEAAQIELKDITGENPEDIIKLRLDLISKYRLDQSRNALQNYKIAKAYQTLGKKEETKKYLAAAVMADIKSSSKNIDAIKALSLAMQGEGDSRRALNYITLAKEDADFYGSQLQKVEIGAILPSIQNNAFDIKRNRSLQTIIAFIIAVAAIGAALYLFLLLRKERSVNKELKSKLHLSHLTLKNRNSELNRLQTKLKECRHLFDEVNALKDEYLRQSLYGNTEILNSIETKLKKLDTLPKEKRQEGIKLADQFGIREERQKIFKSFDRTFLKMFPGFIDELNKLFRPEDKISIGEEEDLPVDIRIFALIRLGITEPSEIASFLNLSIKTVYVYKTKLKSKAIVDNNEFEGRLMQIPGR